MAWDGISMTYHLACQIVIRAFEHSRFRTSSPGPLQASCKDDTNVKCAPFHSSKTNEPLWTNQTREKLIISALIRRELWTDCRATPLLWCQSCLKPAANVWRERSILQAQTHDEPQNVPLGQVGSPLGRSLPRRFGRWVNWIPAQNGKSIELYIQFSQFAKVHNKLSVSALIEYTLAKLKGVLYWNDLLAIWNFPKSTLDFGRD